MSVDEVNQLLQGSFSDRKISRSELQTLAKFFEKAGNKRDAVFDLVRRSAFDLAKKHTQDDTVLNWLEAILEGIDKASGSVAAAGGGGGAPASNGSSSSSGAYFSPGNDPFNEIVCALSSAKKTCDICVFTITDNRISSEIERAAKRGVAVRVITDDEKALDLGADIAQLKKATGVTVRTDKTPAHMHHKFMVVDSSRLITGSFNWTRSASTENEENLLSTSDDALVKAFQKQFEVLWAKFQ